MIKVKRISEKTKKARNDLCNIPLIKSMIPNITEENIEEKFIDLLEERFEIPIRRAKNIVETDLKMAFMGRRHINMWFLNIGLIQEEEKVVLRIASRNNRNVWISDALHTGYSIEKYAKHGRLFYITRASIVLHKLEPTNLKEEPVITLGINVSILCKKTDARIDDKVNYSTSTIRCLLSIDGEYDENNTLRGNSLQEIYFSEASLNCMSYDHLAEGLNVTAFTICSIDYNINKEPDDVVLLFDPSQSD